MSLQGEVHPVPDAPDLVFHRSRDKGLADVVENGTADTGSNSGGGLDRAPPRDSNDSMTSVTSVLWGISTTLLVTVYGLSEDDLVNYVTPGALQPTTHSHDPVLMRFRRLGWHFMCLCNFWVFIRPPIPYRYIGEGSGCETEYKWGTCEDLNPA